MKEQEKLLKLESRLDELKKITTSTDDERKKLKAKIRAKEREIEKWKEEMETNDVKSRLFTNANEAWEKIESEKLERDRLIGIAKKILKTKIVQGDSRIRKSVEDFIESHDRLPTSLDDVMNASISFYHQEIYRTSDKKIAMSKVTERLNEIAKSEHVGGMKMSISFIKKMIKESVSFKEKLKKFLDDYDEKIKNIDLGTLESYKIDDYEYNSLLKDFNGEKEYLFKIVNEAREVLKKGIIYGEGADFYPVDEVLEIGAERGRMTILNDGIRRLQDTKQKMLEIKDAGKKRVEISEKKEHERKTLEGKTGDRMNKDLIEKYYEGKGWKRVFGLLRKTTENGTVYRMKPSDLSFRTEMMVKHDNGSISWIHRGGGYYKDFYINEKGALTNKKK